MASSSHRIALDTGAWRRARAERLGRRAAFWSIPLVLLAALLGLGMVVWSTLLTDSGSHARSSRRAHVVAKAAVNPPAAALREPAAARAPLPAPKTVTVAVWNTSNTSGAAGRTAGPLRSAGFNVVAVTNAQMDLSRTTIFYVAGAQPAAIAVARKLGLTWRATAPLDGMSTQSVRPARVIVAVATN